jgi:hypothetical protein
MDSTRRKIMDLNRPYIIAAIGAGLVGSCGSAIARKLGLSVWEMVPLVGFAVGVVFASQAGLGKLFDRVAALERKADGAKGAS